MAEKIKLFIALSMIIASLASFYMLTEYATIIRALIVVAGFTVAFGIAWTTELGQRFNSFAKLSVTETRKVVWPTRKETIQTTGLVVALVFVMSIFLWVVDASLMSIMKLIMGQGE